MIFFIIWAIIIIGIVIFVIFRGIKNGSPPVAAERSLILEGSRPTVTRVATGAVLLGTIGALIGFAARKKTKQHIAIK